MWKYDDIVKKFRINNLQRRKREKKGVLIKVYNIAELCFVNHYKQKNHPLLWGGSSLSLLENGHNQ